jgi:hypothetical protein
MIRQAHTYLAGAVSSTALVATAVVAFVLLVSFQALRDWPLAGIGIGGDDSAATGPSNPGGGGPAASPAQASVAGATAGPVANAGTARNHHGGVAGARRNQAAVDASPTATTGSPVADAPSPSPAGGQGGTAPSGSPSPIGSASSSPASGGGGGSGGGGSNPSPGGGGSGGTTESGGQTTSGALTETVNKTVSGVDEATGGVLGSTGVTEATGKVVESVAGPESTVGHTVDEVIKTVGGLLGGNK